MLYVQTPPPTPLLTLMLVCTLLMTTQGFTVVKRGALPAGSTPVVHHWHAVTLEVTDGMASGKVDNATIFEGVPVSHSKTPSSPSKHIIAQCVANTTVIKGKVIAGGDYRQVPLSGTIPVQIAACEQACCEDVECTAWAVVYSKCWLKNGGTLETRTGEDGCGFKPEGPASVPSAASVPPSGWAGIVSTLGLSQVDNFELVGTADLAGDAAAPRCKAGGATAGASVKSTPCDLPGTVAGWSLSKTNGALQLRAPAHSAIGATSSTGGNGGSALCIGAQAGSVNVSVVECGSASELVFKESTGLSNRSHNTRITTVTQHYASPLAIRLQCDSSAL